MSDPMALRVFEQALKNTGYLIAERRPCTSKYIGEYTWYGARRTVGESRTAYIGIFAGEEEDEAVGWQRASAIVRLLGQAEEDRYGQAE